MKDNACDCPSRGERPHSMDCAAVAPVPRLTASDRDREAAKRATRHASWLEASHANADRAAIAAAIAAAREEGRAEGEALHEWECPSCGATTRARMADADPILEPVHDAFRAAFRAAVGAHDDGGEGR